MQQPGTIFARWTDTEIVGILEKKRDYSIVVYIDEKEAAKSETRYGVAPFRWQEDHRIELRASSTIKIGLFRHSILPRRRPHQIGKYACNVIQLFENNTRLDLTNDKGRTILVGLKMKLSVIPEPTLDFMRRVDDDVARLRDNYLLESALGHGGTNATVSQTDHNTEKVVGACIVPLGKALQLVAKVMDRVAEAHPILKVSWTVLSAVYKTLEAQMLQDGAILDLAESLREILGVAAAFPNLLVVKGTTEVIEEIGQASLRVAALIDECTKHSFLVRTAKFQITNEMKTRIDQCEKNCRDLLEKLDRRVRMGTNETVTKLDSDVQKGFQTIKDTMLANEVGKWLAAPDSSRNYNDARERHRSGTGAWFLDGENFTKWRKSGKSFLCMYGKAGCGKTVLCSSIISHVKDICQKDASSAFAYFFFDRRDAQSALQYHDGFIRSLIQQLMYQCDGFPVLLRGLRGNGHQQPPTHALEDVLRHMLDGFTHAYIMVDSLDECAERRKLLAWIEKILCHKVGALHLLVTSRPEEEIETNLKCPNQNQIYLNNEHVSGDIEAYIDWKIQTEPRLSMWGEGIRMKIKEKLMEKADGTFRWIALQLEELQKCPNAAGLYSQLDRLPRDLDETYHRILMNIDDQHRRDAVIFLQWIALSARPLTLEEIAETAAFDYDPENGPKYNPDLVYRVSGDVFIACSSLIVKSEVSSEFIRRMNDTWPNRRQTDDTRTTVKLSHFSVKEYLTSERIKDGTAATFSINEKISHSFISQTCIAYLLRFESLDSIDDITIEALPLAEYAAENWVFHARLGGNDSQPVVQKLIVELLQSGSPPLLNWIRLWDPDNYWEIRYVSSTSTAEPLYYASLLGFPEASRLLLEGGAIADSKGQKRNRRNFPGHTNALQAACFEGHQKIVHMLLEKGADVNTEGGCNGSALQAASHGGYETIVRLLIENGADVNTVTEGGWCGNALQAASYGGHETIVKLLIETGADVNAQGGRHGNALQEASKGGHETIVRLLVGAGADVNARGGSLGTALKAASHGGYETIVRLLIENGADVNTVTEGGWCGDALQAASYGGHETIVRLLMETGADVSIVTKRGAYGNALRAASQVGHETIVRLLIEAGADVNAQGGTYGNALQSASQGGHETIVRLLTETGADVNARGGCFGDALQAASQGGHVTIVRLLMETGADVNAQGGEYGNALQAASQGGHETIVGLLIETGADVNARGGCFGDALQAASQGGHETIVRLLMETGAYVNTVMTEGCAYNSALQAASHGGHETIVRLLITAGADVNVQGGMYGNALQAASLMGHETIVRLLLENHAEVNIQGGNFGTALQAASSRGYKSLVMLLLDHGADVNMQDYYGNALGDASSRGHEEIVKLLIQKGADVNRHEAQAASALMEASIKGDISIARLLLEHGANVNAPEQSPINALVLASRHGHESVVKLLLERGANVKSRGKALKAATSEGRGRIVRLLLDHGATVSPDDS